MRRISWMFPTLLIAGLAMIRPWSDRIAAPDAQQQVNDRLRGWVYPESSLLGTGEGEVQGGNNADLRDECRDDDARHLRGRPPILQGGEGVPIRA